jgi:YjbE family integral membrane protein
MPPGLQTNTGFWSALATIGSIILIDAVLSGDNALVIGAAASRLPRAQRVLAIFWGGVGAIVARIALAAAATFLLQIPLLRAAGGIVLVYIAIRLLIPHAEGAQHVQARTHFFSAMLTILVADVTMSLDNIIAVGALANGNVILLVGGLLVSMAFLFLASAVIARIIEHLSILLDLASLVLAYTAASLILEDPWAQPYIKQLDLGPLSGQRALVIQIAFVALVLGVDIVLRLFRARRRAASVQVTSGVPARLRSHDEDLTAHARVSNGATPLPHTNGTAAHGTSPSGAVDSDVSSNGASRSPMVSQPAPRAAGTPDADEESLAD